MLHDRPISWASPRRHDHLVILAQCLITITLFFHPVVWWLSEQVRRKRENCCDDSSIRVVFIPDIVPTRCGPLVWAAGDVARYTNLLERQAKGRWTLR